jgi:uncharacterized protein
MNANARTVMIVSAALLTFIIATPAPGVAQDGARQHIMRKDMSETPYIGMWVTDDGHIRHQLLPNGRYDEARGSKESAYQGRYEIKGNHIDYWDDTGFTADGTFVGQNTLHHGGMIFRRR